MILVNREEKSLRHVAMVATFLDDNKPKRHLKSGFAQFQTSSILFNFISFVKGGRNFWVKYERSVCKFRKRKTTLFFALRSPTP